MIAMKISVRKLMERGACISGIEKFISYYSLEDEGKIHVESIPMERIVDDAFTYILKHEDERQEILSYLLWLSGAFRVSRKIRNKIDRIDKYYNKGDIS